MAAETLKELGNIAAVLRDAAALVKHRAHQLDPSELMEKCAERIDLMLPSLALGERQETAEPPHELVKYLTMRRDFYKGGCVYDTGSDFDSLTKSDVCEDAARDLDKAISALAVHREGPATADADWFAVYLDGKPQGAYPRRKLAEAYASGFSKPCEIRVLSAHREGRPPEEKSAGCEFCVMTIDIDGSQTHEADCDYGRWQHANPTSEGRPRAAEKVKENA